MRGVTERVHSRVYWLLMDEYQAVWDDPLTLGTYVQLLVHADMSWKAPEDGTASMAKFPADVDWPSVARLKLAGLVITEDDKRYCIKGLDKDRMRRREIAQKGGRARWADRSSATSSAGSDASARSRAMLEKKRIEEKRTARASEADAARGSIKTMAALGDVVREVAP